MTKYLIEWRRETIEELLRDDICSNWIKQMGENSRRKSNAYSSVSPP